MAVRTAAWADCNDIDIVVCLRFFSCQSSLAKTVEEDNKVILYPPQVWRKIYIMDYNVATWSLTLIRCQSWEADN